MTTLELHPVARDYDSRKLHEAFRLYDSPSPFRAAAAFDDADVDANADASFTAVSETERIRRLRREWCEVQVTAAALYLIGWVVIACLAAAVA